jgi:hypothetical protein
MRVAAPSGFPAGVLALEHDGDFLLACSAPAESGFGVDAGKPVLDIQGPGTDPAAASLRAGLDADGSTAGADSSTVSFVDFAQRVVVTPRCMSSDEANRLSLNPPSTSRGLGRDACCSAASAVALPFRGCAASGAHTDIHRSLSQAGV